MPRRSQIDAAAALNHIVVKGIERRAVSKPVEERHALK